MPSFMQNLFASSEQNSMLLPVRTYLIDLPVSVLIKALDCEILTPASNLCIGTNTQMLNVTLRANVSRITPIARLSSKSQSACFIVSGFSLNKGKCRFIWSLCGFVLLFFNSESVAFTAKHFPPFLFYFIFQNSTVRFKLKLETYFNIMLPFMKLGLNRKTGLNRFLTSWKSPEDPTPGNCSYRIDPTGYPQLLLYKDGDPYWRAGSWIGDRWSGVPKITRAYIFNISFVNDPDEVSIMYGVIDASIITRMVVSESGSVRRSTWHDGDRRWIEYWFAPKDQCDFYGNCGPNSNCNPYDAGQFECTYLPGLEPKSPGDWNLGDGSAGCVRRGGVSVCRSGEGFVKVARVKVPDTSKARANMSLNLKECKEECLRDCSCTAYASASESLGGSGCLTWHDNLVDTRTFADSGQDLYIWVDAIEKTRSLSQKATAAIILVSIFTALLLASPFLYLLVIKKRKGYNGICVVVSETDHRSHNPLTIKDRDDGPRGNRDVLLFDLSTIASATNNFSVLNKLGQGGFGSVYKGIMDNGLEIAVKRLSKLSGQGTEEFKNEVQLIGKLQHRNLARILGCCVEEDEKMLIYEYLPNKSLDAFLFDKTRRSLLDWRKRLEIASGLARGLLYLHQDSRLRIIHRDLKASNVLLDEEMHPKTSDFGMARICGRDQIQGNTNRVVGTYGYVSPEYAMEEEALRCIQIGLLCVQEFADDRPNMSAVVLMLANDDVALASPKRPACVFKSKHHGTNLSASDGTASLNDITVSTVEGP
ncbi:hypothetical protein EUGRSUZ_D00894 [Eucalyptus grandis]|uniref:non-specific serine/threonine protein kinase n=2 Tax=Eucalyptus grandis TaxID=71139 RepID=A0A059CE41_EUCGR|nr:hypothetical protein EUGRSUZ_D00894 [Eucalyptus grandis]